MKVWEVFGWRHIWWTWRGFPTSARKWFWRWCTLAHNGDMLNHLAMPCIVSPDCMIFRPCGGQRPRKCRDRLSQSQQTPGIGPAGQESNDCNSADSATEVEQCPDGSEILRVVGSVPKLSRRPPTPSRYLLHKSTEGPPCQRRCVVLEARREKADRAP